MKAKRAPLRDGILAYNVKQADSALYRSAAALAKSTGAGAIPEMLRAMAGNGPRAVADLVRVIEAHTDLLKPPRASPRTAQEIAEARAADEARAAIMGDIARDEIAFLALLLRAIADGRDVRDDLRIDKPKAGHRRKSTLGAMLAAEVDRMRADGEAKTKAQACAAVADVTGLPEDAIAQAHTRARNDADALAKRAQEAERAYAATQRKPRPKLGQ